MLLKIKNINLIKILLDIIMAVLLVLMYNKNVISLDFHEVGGLFVCGLFLIHVIINWKWVASVTKKLFSRKLAFKIRFGYIINFLLLLSIILILVSGIFISKVVFTGVSSHNGSWQTVHYAAAALALIIVGIHVGLHWNFVMGMFKKYIKISAVAAKPLSIILVTAVILFGSYSMVTSSFSRWITAPFTASQFEGGRRGPAGFDFQSGSGAPDTGSIAPAENGSSADSASVNSTNSSQASSAERDNSLDSSAQQNSQNEQVIQLATRNSDQTRPQSPNGGNGFDRRGLQQDGQGFPDGGHGGRGERGGSSNVLNVIISFTSIIGLFAAITYYIEKLLRRKKSSQVLIPD